MLVFAQHVSMSPQSVDCVAGVHATQAVPPHRGVGAAHALHVDPQCASTLHGTHMLDELQNSPAGHPPTGHAPPLLLLLLAAALELLVVVELLLVVLPELLVELLVVVPLLDVLLPLAPPVPALVLADVLLAPPVPGLGLSWQRPATQN